MRSTGSHQNREFKAIFGPHQNHEFKAIFFANCKKNCLKFMILMRSKGKLAIFVAICKKIALNS